MSDAARSSTTTAVPLVHVHCCLPEHRRAGSSRRRLGAGSRRGVGRSDRQVAGKREGAGALRGELAADEGDRAGGTPRPSPVRPIRQKVYADPTGRPTWRSSRPSRRRCQDRWAGSSRGPQFRRDPGRTAFGSRTSRLVPVLLGRVVRAVRVGLAAEVKDRDADQVAVLVFHARAEAADGLGPAVFEAGIDVDRREVPFVVVDAEPACFSSAIVPFRTATAVTARSVTGP